MCEHLTLIRGRCASADNEIVIREDTSAEHGFEVGSDVEYLASSFGGGPGEESIRLTVVGVYQTYLPTDVYWADRFMLAGSEGGPFFTNDRTVRRVDGPQLLTTDLIATEEAFRDRSTLEADVKAAMEILSAIQFQPHTEVDSLIDHIEDAEETLLSSLIVATLPLIAICWYVMFLAIVGAVQHRRGELAVTALRGVPGRLRWWLPNAETMVPVLAGAIPGFLFGYVVTAALAAWLLPGAPLVTPTLPAIGLAVLSVVGALLTVVIAQWRVTREPVSNLLRQVMRRGESNAARAVEAVAGVLALVAGFQAATAAGAGGLALLVPLCFGLGIGLLAGRLVAAPAERLGRRLIRRGRLAFGLATIAVARRSGSRAMVALLTVAFGLFGFALTVTDTASQAWEERAHVETGAGPGAFGRPGAGHPAHERGERGGPAGKLRHGSGARAAARQPTRRGRGQHSPCPRGELALRPRAAHGRASRRHHAPARAQDKNDPGEQVVHFGDAEQHRRQLRGPPRAGNGQTQRREAQPDLPTPSCPGRASTRWTPPTAPKSLAASRDWR